MKNYIKEILEKLDRIYTLYERYAWNHKDSEISVIIGDNTISFYLTIYFIYIFLQNFIVFFT